MKPMGNSMDHYWRVIDMANAVGADPAAAMDQGVLSGSEWANMVTLCRSCDWVDGCKKFLASEDRPVPVPSQCLNAQTFRRLTATD
jgi:hypothetical protein